MTTQLSPVRIARTEFTTTPTALDALSICDEYGCIGVIHCAEDTWTATTLDRELSQSGFDSDIAACRWLQDRADDAACVGDIIYGAEQYE